VNKLESWEVVTNSSFKVWFDWRIWEILSLVR